jgi:hypothetical protein
MPSGGRVIKLWRLVTSLPTLAYAGVGAVALTSALWLWHKAEVRRADQRGRAAMLASARFDSALIAMTIQARAKAMARVDTVRDTVRVRVDRVRAAAERIPDTLRIAYPVVDTLVVESGRLVVAVDSLTRVVDAERAASSMAVAVLEAQVTEARLITIRQADQIAAMKRRSKWRTVGEVVGAAGLVTLTVLLK